METWQSQRYIEAGIHASFVQDSLTCSKKGVLRGLHAQEPNPQGKLVQVLKGKVFDVAVDLRNGSPSFGKWNGLELDADIPRQFYIPPGFAHGYYVLSKEALFGYKSTDYYHPETEFALRWDDPAIGIKWPLDGAPLLSEKDRDAPVLSELPVNRLTGYRPCDNQQESC